MSRRHHRVPGTKQGGVLYVLPSIPDCLDPEAMNAIAVSNACSVNGECPDCGAEAELHRDPILEQLAHVVFFHEPWCATQRGGLAA